MVIAIQTVLIEVVTSHRVEMSRMQKRKIQLQMRKRLNVMQICLQPTFSDLK